MNSAWSLVLRDAGCAGLSGRRNGLGGLLLGGRKVGEDAHDVALFHDQEVFAIDRDFGAGPFPEQHAVTDLEVDRDQLAGLIAAAGTDRRDLALRRLLFGGIRNDDAALGLFFSVEALDNDPVMERTEFHRVLLSF